VDDFEIIEHEQILSQAGDNKESLLQTALAHFMERHETQKLGSGGERQRPAKALPVSSSFPPVEPKKIPEIVRFEAIQQIPFPLDDVGMELSALPGTRIRRMSRVGIFCDEEGTGEPADRLLHQPRPQRPGSFR